MSDHANAIFRAVPEPSHLRGIRETISRLTTLYEREVEAIRERLRKPPGRVVSIDCVRRYKPAFILLFLALRG